MGESARDLSGAIWSEVEEDDAVAVANDADRLVMLVDDDGWFDELVGHVRLVAGLDRFGRVGRVIARATNVSRIGTIGPLPAVVAVHAVVAANDRADATDAQRLHLTF